MHAYPETKGDKGFFFLSQASDQGVYLSNWMCVVGLYARTNFDYERLVFFLCLAKLSVMP